MKMPEAVMKQIWEHWDNLSLHINFVHLNPTLLLNHSDYFLLPHNNDCFFFAGCCKKPKKIMFNPKLTRMKSVVKTTSSAFPPKGRRGMIQFESAVFKQA